MVVAREKVFGVKLVLWVIVALTVLAIGYLSVSLFIADRLSAPSHHPQELTPTDEGLDYREVSFQSTDGLELAGWWVPGDDPSRAVVLVPGIEGDKSDTHVLKTASVYAGAGYSVLMIDLRAQGRSEGERVTMGLKEVRDVRGALLWLNERGFAREDVILHGFSLGGATVLRAAPESGVAAVVETGADPDGGARLVPRWKRAGTHQLRERLVHLMICEVILQNNPLPAARYINWSDDAL
jgi:fermentation-respiration switch protein FrsA (DUF1100 family)